MLDNTLKHNRKCNLNLEQGYYANNKTGMQPRAFLSHMQHI